MGRSVESHFSSMEGRRSYLQESWGTSHHLTTPWLLMLLSRRGEFLRSNCVDGSLAYADGDAGHSCSPVQKLCAICFCDEFNRHHLSFQKFLLRFKAFSHMLVDIHFSSVLLKKFLHVYWVSRASIITSVFLERKRRQPDSDLWLRVKDKITSPSSWLMAPSLLPLTPHSLSLPSRAWKLDRLGRKLLACYLPVERNSTMLGTK